ncbi:nucleotide exchange factor GrpE [Pseudanabaena sp. PCC 6802]|uniref:nucleotide exchange factor GrpE n=1 Tax=Pseudanabaena sp. PCC 6802 TaxID=118173 RepID=UPI000476E276|nr:helix-turn-helix domain-containing protein [Pseudanabaena sp. PCC 6802]
MLDRTDELRGLMQAAGVPSFRELRDRARISRRAVDTIRQGRAESLKYQDLMRLSQLLKTDLSAFMNIFSNLLSESITDDVNYRGAGDVISTLDLNNDISGDMAIEREIESKHLQEKLIQQRQELRAEFEQATLEKLESMLLQLPTAAYAAQNNSAMPARNLIPLLRPLDELLKAWGIERIAQVGERVSYDPHWHELMDGEAEVGSPAIVRYVGYTKQGKLLYRARVSSDTNKAL